MKVILPTVESAKLLKINKPILPLKNSIVVMGADGSGKSTLSKFILEKLPQLKHHERWFNLQIGRQQDIGSKILNQLNKEKMVDYPDFLQYFVLSVVDDMSQKLNIQPKYIEGLVAPKIYALLTKYLYEENKIERSLENYEFLNNLKKIIEHLLNEMAGVYNNVFYLNVPSDKLITRINQRNLKAKIKNPDIFDKQVSIKETAEVYMDALYGGFKILGAKPINADVPIEEMPRIANEIIEQSGMSL